MLELRDGVYLQTMDDIMADQKNWDELDPCKNMDFSSCPFWMTTNDGQNPIGFLSVEGAKLWLGEA